MALIGIDEAGRGPVLGSLFIAGVRIPEDHLLLETARESKSTTTKQIFETARTATKNDEIQSIVIEITAEAVTQSENLTTTTANWMIELACELTDGTDDVFVDSCYKDEAEFKSYFPQDLFDEIVVEHKADETYPVVSTAGCMAKYHRELHITTVNQKYDVDVGSGYPSDTTTRDFLRNYYSNHSCFPPETRLSWSTCETLKSEAEQEELDAF